MYVIVTVNAEKQLQQRNNNNNRTTHFIFRNEKKKSFSKYNNNNDFEIEIEESYMRSNVTKKMLTNGRLLLLNTPLLLI
jgi:hypothetical protein